MSHRFFLDSTPADSQVTLEGDQAHHAIHVMRFKVGDELILFDGTGVEYKSVVEQTAKKSLTLSVLEKIQTSRALQVKITMVVALPKGDRQKFLIEKLVELGVHKLVPLKTTRSVAVANEKVVERLKKQVIEASKQCGRNVLMEITSEQTLRSLGAIGLLTDDSLNIIADPYEGPAISAFSQEPLKSVLVAVGPEGGFDSDESKLATDLGFRPVRFGPAILRVETAALAAAAVFGIGHES